jgi:peptidoglycan/LPS O-acetylase OafA/YrhL
MRLHFISRLALLLVATFGVVATQVFATHAWTEETLEYMFVIGGGVTIALALLDAMADAIAQRALDALIVLVGAFSVVEALSFGGSELKWWSLGTAAALAALSVIGLAIHEMTTERVVHELSVTSGREPSDAARGLATARS